MPTVIVSGTRFIGTGLIKEGLRNFAQVLQPYTVCLDLIFSPDTRFT